MVYLIAKFQQCSLIFISNPRRTKSGQTCVRFHARYISLDDEICITFINAYKCMQILMYTQKHKMHEPLSAW